MPSKIFKEEVEILFTEFYKDRSEASYTKLYYKLYPYFFNLVRQSYVKDFTRADEIVNEALLRMWMYVNAYNPKKKVWNWANTILVREALTSINNYNHHKHYNIDETYINIPNNDKVFNEINDELEYYVSLLQKPYDDMIRMNLKGYTNVEICNELDIPQHKYSSYMGAAKTSLVRMVKGEDYLICKAHSPEYRAKVSKTMSGRKASEETKRKIHVARLRNWENPQYREKQRLAKIAMMERRNKLKLD